MSTKYSNKDNSEILLHSTGISIKAIYPLTTVASITPHGTVTHSAAADPQNPPFQNLSLLSVFDPTTCPIAKKEPTPTGPDVSHLSETAKLYQNIIPSDPNNPWNSIQGIDCDVTNGVIEKT